MVISHTSRKDFRGCCPEGTARSVIGSILARFSMVYRRGAYADQGPSQSITFLLTICEKHHETSRYLGSSQAIPRLREGHDRAAGGRASNLSGFQTVTGYEPYRCSRRPMGEHT